MKLYKFSIVESSDSPTADGVVNILLNLNHIVSIKPIKIKVKTNEIIDGFWIRLSNGKKYKALQIPQVMSDIFNETLPQMLVSDEAVHSLNMH
ncbi:MAG: hypothetical protein N4A33_03800 [Bacteriovoracaceae bacterium]|jgi:hypothetical protein|nr:hypothetical protein [Bacteriovoracaceae bacterium]